MSTYLTVMGEALSTLDDDDIKEVIIHACATYEDGTFAFLSTLKEAIEQIEHPNKPREERE